MPPAADDALAIGEQDDLEHHGRISRCTGCVIAEAGIEVRDIEHVVDQMIQSVFEGAG